MLQFGRTRAKPAALPYDLRFCRINDDRHQQLLVNVNSCYVLRHLPPSRHGKRGAHGKTKRTVPCFHLPGPGRLSTLINSYVRSGSGLLTDSTAPKRCRPHSLPVPCPNHALPGEDFHYLRRPVGFHHPQGHLGLADARGSVGSVRYRAATVRERVSPQAAKASAGTVLPFLGW